MKKNLAAVLIMAVAVIGWSALVRAQEQRGPAPVEAFYCKLKDGKTMQDLDKVNAGFLKWAEKNDPNYSAWILTPNFGIFTQLPQLIWLGSWPDGVQAGKGTDAFNTADANDAFGYGKVVDCSMGHVLASSTEINAPEGIPGDGVVMFTQCKISEGSDWSKVVAAHKTLSKSMRDMGSKGSSWLFYPMLGGGEINYDYLGVSTFNSFTDYFAAYQIYVDGAWKKFGETMKGVASCNDRTPTVWDVKLLRKGASS